MPPVIFSGRIGDSDLPGLHLVGCEIKEKPSNFVNLEKYVKQIIEESKEFEKKYPSAAGIIFNMKKIKLGNEEGVSFISQGLSVMANKSIAIHLERANYIFILNYNYSGAYVENPIEVFEGADQESKRQIEDEKLKYQTIQKILSTFRFIK